MSNSFTFLELSNLNPVLDLTFVCFRIDHFLNLNATSSSASELYQVANYGLAGQYVSHYDQVGQ